MQSEITGQVTEVKGRTVKSGTIFDVTIGTQKVSTFKAPVAEKAQTFLSQNVKATVDVTQNGQYTNYTLLDVEPLGAQLAPVEGPNGVAKVHIPVANSNGATDAARQESIVRQSSAKSAFTYAAHAGLGVDETFDLARRIYNWCQGVSAVASAEAQVIADAEALAAGDTVPW